MGKRSCVGGECVAWWIPGCDMHWAFVQWADLRLCGGIVMQVMLKVMLGLDKLDALRNCGPRTPM